MRADQEFLDSAEERHPETDFWKPVEGESIIGRLDAIESNRNGDVAKFRDGVAVMKPGYPDGVAGYFAVLTLGIAANLRGRIRAEDSGKYIYIKFDKWVETPNGKARNYTVRLPEPSRCAELIAEAKAKHDGLPF